MPRLQPRTVPHASELLSPDLFVTSGHLTSMHLKRVPQLRPCPSCGKHMAKVSTSEIYECKTCRVFVTEPR